MFTKAGTKVEQDGITRTLPWMNAHYPSCCGLGQEGSFRVIPFRCFLASALFVGDTTFGTNFACLNKAEVNVQVTIAPALKRQPQLFFSDNERRLGLGQVVKECIVSSCTDNFISILIGLTKASPRSLRQNELKTDHEDLSRRTGSGRLSRSLSGKQASRLTDCEDAS